MDGNHQQRGLIHKQVQYYNCRFCLFLNLPSCSFGFAFYTLTFSGEIARKYYTGADCFDDVDELEKEMTSQAIHPAAKHLLNRFKRLMYNVGLHLHIFQLLRKNCPTIKDNWQVNPRKDQIVPYEAVRSGYNLIYAQLVQQGVISDIIDKAFTIVTGRIEIKYWCNN